MRVFPANGLMARNGYQIIDADAHYLEPIEELADYVDEPWRTRIKGVSPSRLLPRALGDRMLQGRIRRDDVDYGAAIGVSSRPQVLEIMRRLDVDATILVANRLANFGHVSSRDLVVALANGYIDYMIDQVADPAQGIYTMPVLPWQAPEEAAEIVQRVGSNPAVVAVCFMTAGPNPPLGDIRYDPIFDAAQACDLPIVFHSAPGLTLVEGSSPVDGFQRLLEGQSTGFLISNIAQLTSVLIQGLPERFPKLRFLFQEAGIYWVPLMMQRLDSYYLMRREEAPLLKGLPSEYILERFYFGTQPLEAPRDPRHLEAILDMFDGRRHCVFSTDYPHFDYDDPVVVNRLSFLSKEDKRNIFAGNAHRLFNFRKGGIQPWESTSSEVSPTSQKTPA